VGRGVHQQVAARERGRRRVAAVSRSVAVGSTALAALFGVVLAQQPVSHASNGTAHPNPAPDSSAATPAPSSTAPSSSTDPSTSVVPSTTVDPPTSVAPVTTDPVPVLQPPPAPPQTVVGGGGVAGSGGT